MATPQGGVTSCGKLPKHNQDLTVFMTDNSSSLASLAEAATSIDKNAIRAAEHANKLHKKLEVDRPHCTAMCR